MQNIINDEQMLNLNAKGRQEIKSALYERWRVAKSFREPTNF